MKRMILSVLVLICLIGTLFALPATAAEAVGGTTQKVGTAAELATLFTKIQAEAAAVLEEDATKRMETVNIELTSDIHLDSAGLRLYMGGQVHLYSTPGKQYKITMDTPLSGLYGKPMFWMEGATTFRASNIVFDGQNNGSASFFTGGGELILEDVTLENFEPEVAMMASVVAGGDANIFVGPNRDRYRFAPVIRMTRVDMKNNTAVITRPLVYVASSMEGAALYITDSTFTNNEIARRAQYFGGAVYVQGVKLEIEKSTFENNRSVGGGAVCAVKSDVTIRDSLFENNQTLQYELNGEEYGDGGGALYLQNNTTANLANTRFVKNKSAISGGAVTLFVNTTATFTGCTFTENEAATHGGAICVADSFDDEAKLSKAIFNACTFTENQAKGHDAEDHFSSSPEAAGGGAIFLHEYCEAYLNEGTVLEKNKSADEGGAVFVSFGGKLFMDGARIDFNEAATDGGGVYLDGTDAYAGYSHENDGNVPGEDDGYAAGGEFVLKDGSIANNVAGRNGGGVYISGKNEVEAKGTLHVYTGGKMTMTGGIITLNTAMDMGGVYVGASENSGIGGILNMTGGAICLNTAGENGNTSTGRDDAGADVYAEGDRTFITVVTAEETTAYIQNPSNTFVPDSIRTYRFTDWYYDYSDQDPVYGKQVSASGIIATTGRYMSSIDPHRITYPPTPNDAAYNALILDVEQTAATPDDDRENDTPDKDEGNENNPGLDVPKAPTTGDKDAILLWSALGAFSVSAVPFFFRRKKGHTTKKTDF